MKTNTRVAAALAVGTIFGATLGATITNLTTNLTTSPVWLPETPTTTVTVTPTLTPTPPPTPPADAAPPYCPTEDSCRPNYDGRTKQWHIVENTPRKGANKYMGTIDGHPECWAIVNATSILYCIDGYTETS